MFFKTDNMSFEILTVMELSWRRFNGQPVRRPFHAICFRLEGGADILTDTQGTVRLEEGDISFAPAGFPFSKQAGPGRIIAVHITSDSDLPRELLRFVPQNSASFRTRFLKLHQVWSKKRPGYQYEAKSILYRILQEIEQQWADPCASAASQRLSASVEYIHEHYSQGDLSVDALSRMSSMSDTYYRKLFVAEYGMTPQQYISRLRLASATELLESGYYSVSEVATRCGFNSIDYFSVFFKKQTGLSPLQYRTKHLHQA